MIEEAKQLKILDRVQNELYPCKNILISFDRDYYNHKNIMNIENNYVEDILNVGLIKSGKDEIYL